MGEWGEWGEGEKEEKKKEKKKNSVEIDYTRRATQKTPPKVCFLRSQDSYAKPSLPLKPASSSPHSSILNTRSRVTSSYSALQQQLHWVLHNLLQLPQEFTSDSSIDSPTVYLLDPILLYPANE